MFPSEALSHPPSAQILGSEYAWQLERQHQLGLDEAPRVREFVATLNLDALRTAASQAMKVECTDMYHIATGGFNAVYLLTFSDGREVVARMNIEQYITDQTLLRDRVLSEAATLRYVRSHCAVPVPQVYAVNEISPNPVGARYILEERILGHTFRGPFCTEAQRTEIYRQIFQCQAEFMRTHFTTIGSIYHRSETNTFYVGPMGPSVACPLYHTVDRGPWTSTRDWLKAYVKSELAMICGDPEKYRKYRLNCGRDDVFAYHVAWLETLLVAMDGLRYLNSIPAAAERPVLQHEDLCGGNILISYEDPTRLAALIDFEGARVVPLWSAMGEPEYLGDTDSEEVKHLREIRHQIFLQAGPTWEEVEVHIEPLRRLRRLVSLHLTSYPTDVLHRIYQEMKDSWPMEEPALADLDKLVALGPAGYEEGV